VGGSVEPEIEIPPTSSASEVENDESTSTQATENAEIATTSPVFTRNLSLGSKGEDIKLLQI
jgi:hypothetical protein